MNAMEEDPLPPSQSHDPVKLKELGNQFFKEGHYDKAIEFYTKAIGTYPSVV
jgi:tetratricopeptide (TPR) repeat protein